MLLSREPKALRGIYHIQRVTPSVASGSLRQSPHGPFFVHDLIVSVIRFLAQGLGTDQPSACARRWRVGDGP
jgi:hypothetical protein